MTLSPPDGERPLIWLLFLQQTSTCSHLQEYIDDDCTHEDAIFSNDAPEEIEVQWRDSDSEMEQSDGEDDIPLSVLHNRLDRRTTLASRNVDPRIKKPNPSIPKWTKNNTNIDKLGTSGSFACFEAVKTELEALNPKFLRN